LIRAMCVLIYYFSRINLGQSAPNNSWGSQSSSLEFIYIHMVFNYFGVPSSKLLEACLQGQLTIESSPRIILQTNLLNIINNYNNKLEKFISFQI
jgi:hypothetical protein